MGEFDKPAGFEPDTAVMEGEEAEEERQDPTADYEWKEEDDHDLASHLTHLAMYYRDFVRTSRYFAWCRTSWNFYYQLAFEGSDEVGIQALGDEGELSGFQINHMRNLLRHLYNLITKDRPALRCRARNADLKSRRQADLGNGLLEYYMTEKDFEEHTSTAIEHALVVAEGFVVMTWDPMEGEMLDADPQRGTSMHPGDVSIQTPVSWNVIRDLGVRHWSKHQWIGIRQPRNKWQLLAQFPEHADAILGAEIWLDVPVEEGDRPFDDNNYLMESDEVECYEFWHRKTLIMPEGAYVLMCGGEVIHRDVMPYRDLPVYRVSAAEIMLTPFGYTPAFDLVGIQEAINTIVSTVITNISAFGVQSLYKKTGSHLKVTQILGGMNLVEAEEKPEPLQLTKSPPEAFVFLESLVRHGELLSNVDQITRGAPDEHVRSGAYAALLQAQSVVSLSALKRSRTRLLEAMGTGLIRMLRDFGQEERIVTIIGKHNQIYRKHFTGDDLDLIDRVTVEVTNPVLSTNAGKIEYAQMLVKTGFVKTPEQILEVFETGTVDTLLQADKAQLSAVAEENEQFLDGEEVASPLSGDHHVMHIREHLSIFGSKETRNDVQLRASVLAHIGLKGGHMELLMASPNEQLLQQILGYEAPPPGGGAPPPGAEGPPPGAEGPPPAPEGEAASELMEAPPVEPPLDGRSVVQMPEPAEAPVVG